MNNYAQILRENNKKVTTQRLAIIDELDKYGHLSIDELYEHIYKKFPAISLATIYKNINSMKDDGLVEEIKLPNVKSKFELKKDEHYHIICKECHRVADIKTEVKTFDLDIPEFNNIKMDSLVLSGVCLECS